MSNIDIIRAWKDEEYRNSLTEEQLSQLPENPAGVIELSEFDMENIGGAAAEIERPRTKWLCTRILCPSGQSTICSKCLCGNFEG